MNSFRLMLIGSPVAAKSNRVFYYTDTYGFVAQFGRASDLHSEGREFESLQIHEYDKLVKLVCRLTFRMFFVWGISAMVERFHGMEEVYRFESDMLQYLDTIKYRTFDKNVIYKLPIDLQ